MLTYFLKEAVRPQWQDEPRGTGTTGERAQSKEVEGEVLLPYTPPPPTPPPERALLATL